MSCRCCLPALMTIGDILLARKRRKTHYRLAVLDTRPHPRGQVPFLVAEYVINCTPAHLICQECLHALPRYGMVRQPYVTTNYSHSSAG